MILDLIALLNNQKLTVFTHLSGQGMAVYCCHQRVAVNDT
jgi:hypothetical protein